MSIFYNQRNSTLKLCATCSKEIFFKWRKNRLNLTTFCSKKFPLRIVQFFCYISLQIITICEARQRLTLKYTFVVGWQDGCWLRSWVVQLQSSHGQFVARRGQDRENKREYCESWGTEKCLLRGKFFLYNTYPKICIHKYCILPVLKLHHKNTTIKKKLHHFKHLWMKNTIMEWNVIANNTHYFDR